MTVRAKTVALQADHVFFRRRVGGPPVSGVLAVMTWAGDGFPGGWDESMREGRRGLHYLRESGDGLHYVVDVSPSSSALPAGGDGKAVTEELVAMVRESLAGEVLPGSCGFDPRRFALSRAAGSAIRISGYSAVLPKLLPLLACADRDVRAAACAVLDENAFWGQQGCVREMGTGAALPGAGERMRWSAARRAAIDRKILAGFIANPLATAKEYSVLPGAEGVVDFLRILALHADPEVAAAARHAIPLAGR